MMNAFFAADPSAGGGHNDNNLALLSIGIALLGTLIGSVWKFSSMTTKFDLAIKHLKKSEREHKRTVRNIPLLESRVARCEEELGVNRGSRPDTTEAEEDEDDEDDEDSG